MCDGNRFCSCINFIVLPFILFECIPGSSKCVKVSPKNLPKGKHFTYLEDPGQLDICVCVVGRFVFQIQFMLVSVWRTFIFVAGGT